MKMLLTFCFFILSLAANADSNCEQQMSDLAYSEYAKSENISVSEARRADLFTDSFKSTSNSYIYEIEIAEQYVSDSESGWFPGTKFKIVLSKSCKKVSIQKI